MYDADFRAGRMIVAHLKSWLADPNRDQLDDRLAVHYAKLIAEARVNKPTEADIRAAKAIIHKIWGASINPPSQIAEYAQIIANEQVGFCGR